jgi:hypothetical protein
MASANHLCIVSMLKTFNKVPGISGKGTATKETILVALFSDLTAS